MSLSLLFNAFTSVNVRKLYVSKKYQMSKHFSGVSSKVLRDNKYYINKIYKSSLQTYNLATHLFWGAGRMNYNTGLRHSRKE